MPASALADSTNSLKRSRSAQFSGGPSHKKQCSDDRKPRCRLGPYTRPSKAIPEIDPFAEKTPTKLQTSVCELEKLLRRLTKTADYATVRALKALAAGTRPPTRRFSFFIPRGRQ